SVGNVSSVWFMLGTPDLLLERADAHPCARSVPISLRATSTTASVFRENRSENGFAWLMRPDLVKLLFPVARYTASQSLPQLRPFQISPSLPPVSPMFVDPHCPPTPIAGGLPLPSRAAASNLTG